MELARVDMNVTKPTTPVENFTMIAPGVGSEIGIVRADVYTGGSPNGELREVPKARCAISAP